jgi:glycosyltransferase involved in cell wall biosynthesis
VEHAYLIPAFQAAKSLPDVVSGLRRVDPAGRILVVDDGSSDSTAASGQELGVDVVSHPVNRGKGAALRTGFAWFLDHGFRTAVTVDADGQHRPEDALRLAEHPANPEALVLGVRDLVHDGAPKANRFSNGFANFWVSLFSGRKLSDTQCGLRRYPLAATLALGSSARGYGFECEMLVRCARRGIAIVETPVSAIYPPESMRVSHFRVVADPCRITLRLVHTALTVRRAP